MKIGPTIPGIILMVLLATACRAGEKTALEDGMLDPDATQYPNLALLDFDHQKIVVPLQAQLRSLTLPGRQKIDLFQWDKDALGIFSGVYFGQVRGDLVSYCQMAGEAQKRWAQLARFKKGSLKPLWMQRIPIATLSLPLIDKDAIYVAGSNLVAKYGLKDGQKLWSLDWPFEPGERQGFQETEVKNGMVHFMDDYDRKLVLDEKTGDMILKDDSSVTEPMISRQPLQLLLCTAYGGYDVVELFADNNPTMGWVNTSLWTVGLMIQASDTKRSLYFREGTPYLLSMYDYSFSFCYPIVTLLDGSNNSNGKLDRAWIGVGADVALITLGSIVSRDQEREAETSLRPVLSPRYAGMAWSGRF